jgi:WD40 repeat protein
MRCSVDRDVLAALARGVGDESVVEDVPDPLGQGDSELVLGARFLAYTDPDRLARVLHRVDRSRSPLLRAYWRALDRLRAAATPGDRAAVLQAMVQCEEPEGLVPAEGEDALGLGEWAGWVPVWSGEGGRSAFHRRLAGHSADPTQAQVQVHALAFGVVGERAVLASGGRDGGVRLWDPRSGELLSALAAHSGAVPTVLEFGVAGGRAVLVSGAADGAVRVWDPGTGELVASFSVPAGYARAAAFVTLDDGRDVLALASGCDADDADDAEGVDGDLGRVDLWEPLTGNHLARLFASDELVLGLVATAVGGRAAVAVVCGDGVRVWGVGDGEATVGSVAPLAQWSGAYDGFRLPPFVAPLAGGVWDGREVLVLVVEEGGVGWDAREWQQTVLLWDPGRGPAGRVVARFPLSESESVLAVGSLANRGSRGSGEELGDRGSGEKRGGRESGGEGAPIVLASVVRQGRGARGDGVLVRVRVLGGGGGGVLPVHTGAFLTGAFGAVDGGTLLATANSGYLDRTEQDDHGIVLSDVPAPFRGSGEPVAGGLALGVDGWPRPVLAVGGDYQVALVDPVTGRAGGRTAIPRCDDYQHGESRGVAVASGVMDGVPLVAVAGIGHGVSLCDPETGAVVRELRRSPHSWSRFVALGDTGRRVLLPGRRAADARRVFLLAEADTSGPVTVWDAGTGEVLGSVDAPGRLSALAFGTVGGRTVLATGHRGMGMGMGSGSRVGLGMVQLWDPVRGKRLERFQGGHSGLALGSVAGRDVIATGLGREVRIGDAGDGRTMAVVANPGATVTCLALSTVRGRPLLVTGDSAGTVRMWDPVTGRYLTTLATFARLVHEVAVGVIDGEAYVFAQSRAGRVVACRLHGGDLSVLWPTGDEDSRGLGLGPGARPVRGRQPWSPV